ncbi:hypothetical protein BSPWISOXPB_7364 [uncultured Gammaproteobacteria bacterium]|nr:hypothetical protein BSPWISOXPB_7364 [uncultured Gammaproteobacteria bacterium]
MTGNNINLNAQNTLLNQSGDIQATNNLNLKPRLLPILPVNKPSQKAQTSLRALAVPQTYKAAMSTSMPKILPTQPATSLLTT